MLTYATLIFKHIINFQFFSFIPKSVGERIKNPLHNKKSSQLASAITDNYSAVTNNLRFTVG